MATFDFRRANHLTQLTMAQADVLPKSPKKMGPHVAGKRQQRSTSLMPSLMKRLPVSWRNAGVADPKISQRWSWRFGFTTFLEKPGG